MRPTTAADKSSDPDTGLVLMLAGLTGAAVVHSYRATAPDRARRRQQRARDRHYRRLSRMLAWYVERAARHVDIAPPPVWLNSQTPNAASHCGYITVNPRWLERRLADLCELPSCRHAFLMFVMAHEVVHEAHRHACGFGRIDTATRHLHEHDADEEAARIVACEGIERDDLDRAIRLLDSVVASRTHPAGSERQRRILAAYDWRSFEIVLDGLADGLRV